MSTYTIQNERFSASIRAHGAELCSIRDRATGREFLWQGDKQVWGGQSPLLFPSIGRLLGAKYRLGDREYPMKKHGFARGMEFEPESICENAVSLLLKDTEETRECYPFSFELRIELSFEGDALVMNHRLTNTGSDTMPFCIGAHPGFFCADGDELLLDAPETLTLYQLDPDAQLIAPTPVPYEVADGRIPLKAGMFARDALMFDSIRSRSITLKRANGSSVRVEYGSAPCVGLWSANTPELHYVCIEPWYGLDDFTNASGEFTEKPHCQFLEPGKTFSFPVRILPNA